MLAQKAKKQIIYSDKSSSSVDEMMMGDTPSNYNILNGRFDGKSAGLKSILQYAQGNPNGQAAQADDPLGKVFRAKIQRAEDSLNQGKTSPRAPNLP